jgi:PP-loop superfamily ATP-utilizing enzyme
MSENPTTLDRQRAAAGALRAHGLPGARVRAAGPEGEIAVVSVPVEEWSRLLEPESARVVAEVKAEGFRYVALDLDPGAGGE